MFGVSVAVDEITSISGFALGVFSETFAISTLGELSSSIILIGIRRLNGGAAGCTSFGTLLRAYLWFQIGLPFYKEISHLLFTT